MTNPDGREHSEDDGPADVALQGKNSYENKLHISGNNNLTPSRVGRRIFTFPSVEGIIFPYSASDITNMLSSIRMAFYSALICLPTSLLFKKPYTHKNVRHI